MKKVFFIGIIILMVIIISGCKNVNYQILYIFEGDYATYEEKDNKFILVDSETELLEIKSTINTLSEENSIGSEISNMKSYFKKNQINFLYKEDNEDKYKVLFEEDTNLEEWFSNNKLIYCCVTTTSSGYQAEVYLKKDTDNNIKLVLDKFNNFQGEGDDEIKTYNFFIPLSTEDVNNLIITLDTIVVELDT